MVDWRGKHIVVWFEEPSNHWAGFSPMKPAASSAVKLRSRSRISGPVMSRCRREPTPRWLAMVSYRPTHWKCRDYWMFDYGYCA